MDNVNWRVFQAAAVVTARQVTTSDAEATRSVFKKNYEVLLEVAQELGAQTAGMARRDRKGNPPQSFVGVYP